MRFTSWLFVGVSMLTLALVALLSFQGRGAGGVTSAGRPRSTSPVLVSADECALRRLRAKGVITRRLIDGELTLSEAGAWFQYLDANFPPAGLETLPDEVGMPERERSRRQVIRWAETAAADESLSRAEAVRRRLNAELNAVLPGDRRDGFSLPDL